VDVDDKLDELTALVEEARSMPMSGSCILSRGEVLGLLDDLRELLPEEFRHAQLLLEDRDAVVDEGRREADRVLTDAQAERDRLLAEGRAEHERLLREGHAEHDRLLAEGRTEHERLLLETEIVAAAQREAEALRADAAQDVAGMRAQTDEYVDAKLADFEAVLTRTLASVQHGRDRLAGRGDATAGASGTYDPAYD
jgi:cell division septum initiation protein DivIVA